MNKIEFVPTTQEHIKELAAEGQTLPFRVKSVTALVDGRPIGLGGIGFPKVGMPTAFAVITDELRRYKVALHKIGKSCIADWKSLGIRKVIAFADHGQPAAERWLLRYGFEKQEFNGQTVFLLRLN